MSPLSRRTIYRIAHDIGVSPRQIVRECRGLEAPEIARRYGVLNKPARCG